MLRLVLVVTLLLAAANAFAKAAGVDSRATFPPIGCGGPAGLAAGCHVQPANPGLMVTIDGPTAIGTNPQDSGLYTVSIPAGSGGLMGAGMNVAIARPNTTGCALGRSAATDKTAFRNESADPNDPVLSHDYPGAGSTPTTLIGVWSYQFLVRNCTKPGRLLLLAAMNAFDGSGDETGEIWNKTELSVTVPEPGATLLGAAAITALASMPGRKRISRPGAHRASASTPRRCASRLRRRPRNRLAS